MKLYVSSDQEGVSGIATRSRDNWDQAENKRLQTEEMVALCESILEYNPKTEIVVNDSHGKGLNLDFEKLPESVDMIRQSPEILDQMYGIDESYDGFMFFAHAMRGVLGALLSHVWEVHDVKINGKNWVRLAWPHTMLLILVYHSSTPAVMTHTNARSRT